MIYYRLTDEGCKVLGVQVDSMRNLQEWLKPNPLNKTDE